MGIFFTALMTLVTPILCKIGGISFLIAIRVIQGIFSGLSFPANNEVYSKWLPPCERTRTVKFGTSGYVVNFSKK